MKIGIIGLNVNNMELNYGTALHTYAFIEFVKRNNIAEAEDIEVINYFPKHSEGLIRKHPYKFYLHKHDLKKTIKMLTYSKEYAKRYEMFHKFVDDNFNLGVPYNQEQLEKANLNYDCIVVESDTVWCKLGGKFDPAFYLNFDSMKHANKIAYAPDTGVLVPTTDDYSEMNKLLLNVDWISGRGTHASEVISNATNKDVANVVDPTLLVSAKEYDLIAKTEPIIKEKYVLVYTVGLDSKMIDSAKKYASKHNCKILEFTSRITKDNLFKFDRKMYVKGMDEFLSAIKFADCIFTNSFHGICISLVYHKEFYAFQRQGNKIKDICAVSGLSERLFEDREFKESKAIIYSEVDEALKLWINSSKEWLISALNNQKQGD